MSIEKIKKIQNMIEKGILDENPKIKIDKNNVDHKKRLQPLILLGLKNIENDFEKKLIEYLNFNINEIKENIEGDLSYLNTLFSFTNYLIILYYFLKKDKNILNEYKNLYLKYIQRIEKLDLSNLKLRSKIIILGNLIFFYNITNIKTHKINEIFSQIINNINNIEEIEDYFLKNYVGINIKNLDKNDVNFNQIAKEIYLGEINKEKIYELFFSEHGNVHNFATILIKIIGEKINKNKITNIIQKITLKKIEYFKNEITGKTINDSYKIYKKYLNFLIKNVDEVEIFLNNFDEVINFFNIKLPFKVIKNKNLKNNEIKIGKNINIGNMIVIKNYKEQFIENYEILIIEITKIFYENLINILNNYKNLYDKIQYIKKKHEETYIHMLNFGRILKYIVNNSNERIKNFFEKIQNLYDGDIFKLIGFIHDIGKYFIIDDLEKYYNINFRYDSIKILTNYVIKNISINNQNQKFNYEIIKPIENEINKLNLDEIIKNINTLDMNKNLNEKILESSINIVPLIAKKIKKDTKILNEKYTIKGIKINNEKELLILYFLIKKIFQKILDKLQKNHILYGDEYIKNTIFNKLAFSLLHHNYPKINELKNIYNIIDILKLYSNEHSELLYKKLLTKKDLYYDFKERDEITLILTITDLIDAVITNKRKYQKHIDIKYFESIYNKDFLNLVNINQEKDLSIDFIIEFLNLKNKELISLLKNKKFQEFLKNIEYKNTHEIKTKISKEIEDTIYKKIKIKNNKINLKDTTNFLIIHNNNIIEINWKNGKYEIFGTKIENMEIISKYGIIFKNINIKNLIISADYVEFINGENLDIETKKYIKGDSIKNSKLKSSIVKINKIENTNIISEFTI